MSATRSSNIELCRIVTIILVMLVHTTFQSIGWPETNDTNMILLSLLGAFTVVGVNVFILITGYFSATPKKTSLINLAFICFFWMIIRVVAHLITGLPISANYLFFITKSNWFIPSYIGLLFIAPILNFFVKSVSNNVLHGSVIALLIIEFWFGWLPPEPMIPLGFQNGYSLLSFIILYLLARYIRLYGVPVWMRRFSLSIYLSCSVILVLLSVASISMGHPCSRMIYAYNNPIVILSSVCFFLSFEKLKIKDSKRINHIAKSTLAILLGHSAIFSLYTSQYRWLFNNVSNWKIVFYWILSIVIVFCASILLDQLRLLLYKPIEKYMANKIVKNDIY